MASCTSCIGNLLVLAAAIMGCISIGTPYWAESAPPGEFHWGLWQACVNGTCADLVNDNQHAVAGWFNITRSSIVVAVGITLFTFLISLTYMCCTCCQGSLKAVQTMAIFMVLACVGVVISVLTFALQKGNRKFTGYSGPIEYGWSYWVCVATGAALLVGMVSFVCETSNARRRAPYAYIPPTDTA